LGYTDFDDPSMDHTYADVNGEKTVITKAANMAFDRGIVVVVSAGNYGDDAWKYISPPADGKNVLAVGSVNINFSHSPFSSFGPTSDGRIKPDVMALGNPTATIIPNGSVKDESGTSVSCPLVTSLVAGVIENWPELTAAQINQLIKQSGSLAFNPDNTYGYGIPTYRAIKNIFEFPSSANSTLLAYPNPVIDILNIGHSPVDGSEIKVRVSSILGQPLMEITYESIWHLNPIEIDLSSLQPGLYLVKVENMNSQQSFRIIKR
jgi:subtilisin family serine protease